MTTADRTAAPWEAHYRDRLVSPEHAMAQVKSGDRIYLYAGAVCESLISALIARSPDLEGVSVEGLPYADYGWFSDDLEGHVTANILYALPATRDGVNRRRSDYTPWWIFGHHKALDEGRPGAREVDVSLITVTPPNKWGYCSFGHSLWDGKTTAKRAKLVIAAINPGVPSTFGDTWIHTSEIDWFVEADEPLTSSDDDFYPPPDPWDEPIGRYVASLVKDGDTIQIGTGSTTGNINRIGALDGKHDLGYFAELTVPGTVDLVRKGVITSKHMTTHPGKFVSATAGNNESDLEFIDGNPVFEFYSTDYMHDPRAIARNDNMVAINNALTIDLTGQIGASTVGTRIYSGTGGHLSYALGAFLSKGGRYICVLPSTAVGGTKSRITPHFEPGQIVTVPRDLADIVVTEHGIAHLLNKTQRQRADELIAVSHPDFRAELRREADRLF